MFNLNFKNINTKETFNIDLDWEIESFQDNNDYIPEIDNNYLFDKQSTQAILAGFKFNKKVLIQGLHGTGKSTHIEQVAARLKWPVMRINFDGFITRSDLVGKDIIKVNNEKQITEFKEGIIPWAIQHPIALILDEYDAARPDVLFVIQRLLENEGKFTLIDENKVITPHKYFRLFATSNTLGFGDLTGLYAGTHILNQGQLDRWQIIANLNYLSAPQEESLIIKKYPELSRENTLPIVKAIVNIANLTREGFKAGDISSVMSPRTSLNMSENFLIFKSTTQAFLYSFFNKTEEEDRRVIREYYQRCFGEELII